jgi:homoserine O-acetyltransferase/O-succinyltransferase
MAKKKLIRLLFGFFIIAVGLFMSQQLFAQPQQDAIYVITEFVFENGTKMQNLKVGYNTYGQLNSNRDNAVLVTHATNGIRKSFDRYIGPGKAFDTNKYFVIAVDAIGSGLSSGPADGMGMNFPRYTIRDMVKAQYDLVTNGLKLNKLLAVGGPSMGSFQALEWGIHYPDFVKGLICIVPGAKASKNFQAIVDGMIATVQLDPAWQGGQYSKNPVDGLRRAGMIFVTWLRSDAFFESLKSKEEYEGALMFFGNAYATWDARNWMYRYFASRDHDVSKPFDGNMDEALGRIKAKALIMPSRSDRLIPPAFAQDLQKGIKSSTFVEIPSILGHLAYFPPDDNSPEYALVSSRISQFLATLQ